MGDCSEGLQAPLQSGTVMESVAKMLWLEPQPNAIVPRSRQLDGSSGTLASHVASQPPATVRATVSVAAPQLASPCGSHEHVSQTASAA